MRCENFENNKLCEGELKRGSAIYINGKHVCNTCFKFLRKRKKEVYKEKCCVPGCRVMIRKRAKRPFAVCRGHYGAYFYKLKSMAEKGLPIIL